jgi:hypothetical protein
LQDNLDARLGHRRPDTQFTMYRSVAVQDTAQVVEGPGDIEAGNIDVPVLMRGQWLLEARALLRRLAGPFLTGVPPVLPSSIVGQPVLIMCVV